MVIGGGVVLLIFKSLLMCTHTYKHTHIYILNYVYELYTCATCIHVPKAGVKVRDNLWSQFSPRDPPQIFRLRGEAHLPLSLLTNPFSVIVESHTVAWNSGQPLISTRVLGWKV